MDCAASIACQLDRIADALSGFDWNAFLSTLIATIIGAGVAALIGLAVARAERPQPFFSAVAQPGITETINDNGIATVRVAIWNIGDGPAYNVRYTVAGSAKEADHAFTVAKLESGDSLPGWIRVPSRGANTWNQDTLQVDDRRRVRWPGNAAALIEWQQPPQRNRVRRQRISLADPFA